MSIHRGFSLIELLVGISILAILGGIGLTIFRNVQGKDRDSKRKQDLRQLGVALEIYRQSSSGKYIITPAAGCGQSNSGLFYDPVNGIAPFMSNNNVPEDPSDQSQYCYYSENSGKSFRLFAKLENCSDPDVIPGPCSPTDWNFSIASADLTLAAAGVAPTPTPTALPSPTPAYARVFVTSTTYNGNLGGLAGADSKCQTQANTQPSLAGSTWKAWLSDSTDSVTNRLNHNTFPYKLLNGTSIAIDWADLTDLTILAPINITENNTSITSGAVAVWTGTTYIGTWTGNACSDWTDTSGATGHVADHGNVVINDIRWTDNFPFFRYCDQLNHLYCFEQ